MMRSRHYHKKHAKKIPHIHNGKAGSKAKSEYFHYDEIIESNSLVVMQIQQRDRVSRKLIVLVILVRLADACI